MPGGGVSYLRAQEAVIKGRPKQGSSGDEKFGFRHPVERSLEAPCPAASLDNTGIDGDVVVEKVKDGTGAFGFNAGTGTYTRT